MLFFFNFLFIKESWPQKNISLPKTIKPKNYHQDWNNNKYLLSTKSRIIIMGSRGLLVRVRLVTRRSRVRVSGPTGIVGGGVNNQLSLLLQYHDWGETQGTKARHQTPNCSPGAAALAAHCSGCVFTVCGFTAVCVLDRLNAEHKFRVWVKPYLAHVCSLLHVILNTGVMAAENSSQEWVSFKKRSNRIQPF